MAALTQVLTSYAPQHRDLSGPSSITFVTTGHAADDGIFLLYDGFRNLFVLRRIEGSAIDEVTIDADTFTAGDDLTVAGWWTDALIAIKKNGLPAITAASVTEPQGVMGNVEFGSDQNENHADVNFWWVLTSDNELSDSVVDDLHSGGNTDPDWQDYTEFIDFSFLWPADDETHDPLNSRIGESASGLNSALDYLELMEPDGLFSLAETTGDMSDLSDNANHASVTLGTGVRGVSGLYTNSPGAMDFDGATSFVSVPTATENSGIFTGPGAVAWIMDAASAGESGAGVIFGKLTGSGATQTRLRVQSLSGGRVHLRFDKGFSGTGGAWTTSGTGPVVVGNPTLGVILYDGSSVSNNPTIHLFDLVTQIHTELTVGSGLSVTTTPVGTSGNDAAAALTIGGSSLSFEGTLGAFAFWKGRQPSFTLINQVFRYAAGIDPL